MKICVSCQTRYDDAGWRCPKCGNEPPLDRYRILSPTPHELVDAYDADEFSAAAAAERSSFWAKGRNRLIAWALARYFPEARSLLEVGCGTGIVLGALRSSFPELTLVGGDPYPLALDLARAQLEHVELLLIDGRRIPFADEFDVVGCFDTLEHVLEDEQVLSEMFRAVRPGGGLLLTVPQHPRLWSAADEWTLHLRRYTRRALLSKVRRSGFRVVRVTSFVSLLLPLMAASRLWQRDLESYNPCGEFRLPRPVQTVLASTLALERQLIKAGVSLPAGGSLLVVGRKPARMSA